MFDSGGAAGWQQAIKKSVILNIVFYFIQYSSISFLLVLSQSLFLKKAGPDYMPMSFMALNSFLVLFELWLLSLKKVPEYKILLYSLTFGTIYNLICDFYLFNFQNYLVYFLNFIICYLFIIIILFGYLTYINDVLPIREQKKYLPYIHGASSLGAVISGFSIGPLISFLGVSGVIKIIIAMNVLSFLIILKIEDLRKKFRSMYSSEEEKNQADNDSDGLDAISNSELDKSGEIDADLKNDESVINMAGKRLREAFRFVMQDKLAHYLIIIVFLINFMETLIDYLYSVKLVEELVTVDQIASFSGKFRAVNMVLIMMIQIFALKPFMKFFSVSAAMLVMPITLLPASGVCIIFYTFATALSIKFLHEISIKCFNRPALGILTNPAGEFKTKIFVFYELSAYLSKIAGGAFMYFSRGYINVYYFLYLLLALYLVYFYYSIKIEPAYISALKHNIDGMDARSRKKIIETWSYLSRAAAIETASQFLKSKDKNERFKAINAISVLGESGLLYSAIDGEDDPKNIACIVSALSKDAGFDFENKILGLLGHENFRVRSNVIEGLSNFSNPENNLFITNLLAGYLNDRDARIRGTSIVSLLKVSRDEEKIKSAITCLYEMFKSSEANFRSSAVYSMGSLGNPCFVPALGSSLFDPEISVRKNSVMALGNIGGIEAAEFLKKAAAHEHDIKIKNIIKSCLTAFEDGKASIINDSLASHSSDFRKKAFSYFEKLDKAKHYNIILNALKFDRDNVKLSIIKHISRNANDEEFISFISASLHADSNDLEKKAGFDFSEFEKLSVSKKFEPGTAYMDFYAEIAPQCNDANAIYIIRHMDFFIFASYIKNIVYSGEVSDEIISLLESIEKKAGVFLFDLIAASSSDGAATLKNIDAALFGDLSSASCAIELL